MYKKLQYSTVVTNNDERKPDEGELSDSCVLLLPEKAQISAAKQYISGEENISGQLYINSWSNELVSSRFLNLIQPKKLFLYSPETFQTDNQNHFIQSNTIPIYYSKKLYRFFRVVFLIKYKIIN